MPHPKAGKTKNKKQKPCPGSQLRKTTDLGIELPSLCVCECVCGGDGALIPSTTIVIDNNKQINELSKEELVDGGKRGRKSNEVRVGVDIQLYIR